MNTCTHSNSLMLCYNIITLLHNAEPYTKAHISLRIMDKRQVCNSVLSFSTDKGIHVEQPSKARNEEGDGKLTDKTIASDHPAGE